MYEKTGNRDMNITIVPYLHYINKIYIKGRYCGISNRFKMAAVI